MWLAVDVEPGHRRKEPCRWESTGWTLAEELWAWGEDDLVEPSLGLNDEQMVRLWIRAGELYLASAAGSGREERGARRCRVVGRSRSFACASRRRPHAQRPDLDKTGRALRRQARIEIEMGFPHHRDLKHASLRRNGVVPGRRHFESVDLPRSRIRGVGRRASSAPTGRSFLCRGRAGVRSSAVSVSALPDSRAAQELVARHARRTPLLTSRLLSEETGFDVRLKAELFQRTGSYKIRGPLVKLERLTRGGAGARGRLLLGRESRARGCARRRAARRARGRRDGRERDAVEGRGDARLRRRGRPPRNDLGRGRREGARARRVRGARVRAPVRRRRPDLRPGDGRARDPRGLARGRADRRADRRRRAHLRDRGRRQARAPRRSHRRRRVGRRAGDEDERRAGRARDARSRGDDRRRPAREAGRGRRRSSSSVASWTRSSPCPTSRSSRTSSGRWPARSSSSRALLRRRWPRFAAGRSRRRRDRRSSACSAAATSISLSSAGCAGTSSTRSELRVGAGQSWSALLTEPSPSCPRRQVERWGEASPCGLRALCFYA